MPEVSDWSPVASGNANVAGFEWTADTERNLVAPQMREMMAQLRRWYGTAVEADTATVKTFGAVGDGVADDSAAFNAMRASASGPGYVPPGTYRVAAATQLLGFHGPGVVIAGGNRWPLPAAPNEGELARAIIHKIAPVRATQGVICYVGDSITEATVPADNVAASFPTLMRQMLDRACSLQNAEWGFNFAGPGGFGVTLSGTSTVGTAGPCQRSRILQPGAKILFNGQYAFVDVMYEQASGAGTLTFKRSGSTFRTLVCAGSAESNVISFPGATGSVTDEPYEIENTGTGPVEVTGLLRINFPPPGGRAIYHARMGVAGQSTTLIQGDAQIESILRVMRGIDGSAPSRSLMIFAHGINNYQVGVQTTTVAVYKEHCRKIFSRVLAAGHGIIALPPMIPNSTTWPGTDNIHAYIAALYEVCTEFRVPIVPLNAVDFLNLGLFSDDLHPTAAGYQQIFRMLCETLAEGPELLPNFGTGNSYLPVLKSQGSYTTQTGRFVQDGIVTRVRGFVKVNTAAAFTGGMTVTLPTVVSGVWPVQPGSVGRAIGFAVPANADQFVIEAVPGTNTALVRAIDAVGKNVAEATALDNGAELSFALDYISA
jgi:lysophospholipase L1-like esterase